MHIIGIPVTATSIYFLNRIVILLCVMTKENLKICKSTYLVVL